MAPRTKLHQAAQIPGYWHEAVALLSARDPVMGRIALAAHPQTLRSRGAPFTTLVRSIVGQQISVKAADAVWARMTAVLGAHPQQPEITPSAVISQSALLASVGLSARKRIYIHGLAQWFIANSDLNDRLVSLSDQEVIGLLTAQHGIGRWTAEMFLIFTLMRPDVFPVDDLGVLKALDLHYSRALAGYRRHHPGETPAARRARALRLAERWRPYRTVASWLLWRSLDPVPVEY
ncbi:MAG: DNA-3-methyladenine glycosylase 2 family protein [Betaproteobacteria bacterium]|nr:DNA-3-methyladenine glycosylase 2 family protein [Betaproteobacteria bacterium]